MVTDAATETTSGTSTDHLTDRSVTVVIATRDRPELLRRAIAGVEQQTHDQHVEIILVFDRSEPDLALARDEDNFRIVVTTNVHSPGLAGARNSGIKMASNNWIALCDDDDEWLPGKLSAQFDALESNPDARAACTGIFIRYEGDDTPRVPDPAKMTFEEFLNDRMTEVHPSSWLVHRQTFIDDVGLVDENIPGGYAEDYDFILRTVRFGPIAVAEKPLVRIWWHGGSFFFERWKTIDEALQYILTKYPEFEQQPKGLARIKGQQAVARAAMKDRSSAVRTAWETFKLSKTEKRVPVALIIAAGLPADRALKMAHRFGKGI